MGILSNPLVKMAIVALVTMAVVSRVRPLRDIVAP